MVDHLDVKSSQDVYSLQDILFDTDGG